MKNLRLGLICWLLFTAMLAFTVMRHWGYTPGVTSERVMNAGMTNLSRMWFTGDGRLIGFRRDEAKIHVLQWLASSGKLDRQRIIDLAERKADPTSFLFAISDDGARMAWISGGVLHVEPLFSHPDEQPLQRKLPSKQQPVGLAFPDPGQVGIVYESGDLEVLDPRRDAPVASTHIDVKEPGPLLSAPPYLATYSTRTHETFVYDTRQQRLVLIEYHTYVSEPLAVALSPGGRMAIGTDTGVAQLDKRMVAPGSVRAIAFDAEGRVFGAGDFRGIYLLSADEQPMEVVAGVAGVQTLAASITHLAHSAKTGTELWTYHRISRYSKLGKVVLPVWVLLAFLGMMQPVLTERLRALLRRRRKKAPTREAKVEDDEAERGGVPRKLVEACLAGDCVIYAGAGLSRLAGMPPWRDFLRALLELAAKETLADERALQAARSELEVGGLDAASDRIAAFFEGHEEILNAYMRKTFLTANPPPPTHGVLRRIDFPGIVTTNFDNLLELAFPQSGGRVYTIRDAGQLRSPAQRQQFFLIKLFGLLQDPHSVCIGPKQRAAAATREFSAVWQELWSSRTFLFVGASLRTIDGILMLLARSYPPGCYHYALVESSAVGEPELATAVREQYGIEVIAYTKSAPDHPEVIAFLEKLARSLHAGFEVVEETEDDDRPGHSKR